MRVKVSDYVAEKLVEAGIEPGIYGNRRRRHASK